MTAMRRYGRSEIEDFLKQVDAHLRRPADVIVIGWAAAMLRYDAPGRTIDIDTWSDVAGLQTAVAEATEATGLSIPFGSAGVADAPYDFESRLERAMPRLKRLRIQVPEKHDLALMKAVRGLEHDFEALATLHRQSPLDSDLLARRFRDEMGHAMGDPARLRGNFLALVERLFPDRVDAVAAELRKRKRLPRP